MCFLCMLYNSLHKVHISVLIFKHSWHLILASAVQVFMFNDLLSWLKNLKHICKAAAILLLKGKYLIKVKKYSLLRNWLVKIFSCYSTAFLHNSHIKLDFYLIWTSLKYFRSINQLRLCKVNYLAT